MPPAKLEACFSVPLHGTFQWSRLYNSKVVDFFRNYFICKLPRAYLSGHPPPRNPLNSCLGITTVDGWIKSPGQPHWHVYNIYDIYIYTHKTLFKTMGWYSPYQLGEVGNPGNFRLPAIHHPPSTHLAGGRFRRRRHGTKSCNMCASDKLRLPGGLRGRMMAPSEQLDQGFTSKVL